LQRGESREHASFTAPFWLTRPATATLAFAVLVLIAVGIWLVQPARRPTFTSTDAQPPPPPAVSEVPNGSGSSPVPLPESPLPPRPTLALAIGDGIRGPDPAAPLTLAIPAGATEARVEITLHEPRQTTYRVVIRAIGGDVTVSRSNLRAAEASGLGILRLTVPTERLPAGDYIVSVQAEAGGAFEELSQTIVRVVEAPR
jgi:hypothetical protein